MVIVKLFVPICLFHNYLTTMITNSKDFSVLVCGKPHKKNVILADVNIPYKFSIDRNQNTLFFCINADEFSDQSFHSVVLNIDTGLASVIPGIHNGFASAVNQATGDVYLGGSDGIYKYNYWTNDIEKPALVRKTDIFDMYYSDKLYFVDTAKQNLYVYKDNTKCLVPEAKKNIIKQFVIDANSDLYFVNPTGLFVLKNGCKSPTLVSGSDINFRGATTDAFGIPFFMADNGIYSFHKGRNELVRILSVNNGYGLAFDKHNNIVYSDERTVIMLVPY